MSKPPPIPLIEAPEWLGAAGEGDSGQAQAPAIDADANLAHLQAIADAVNPRGGTENCGKIIDAVIARETGTDPNAVAQTGVNGTYDEIEERHHTEISWGSSFDEAYEAVQDGGDGTIAVVGMDGDDINHIVALVNHEGTVGIVEGQGDPVVITSPEAAQAEYDPGGTADIGFGIVGSED